MGRRRKTQNQAHKTTADHLARAVFDDLLPEDRQTCEDYGFDRAVTAQEKCFLLGLYQGLIKFLDISPKTIHDWRVRGVLVDEIKAAYYKIPERSRGLYFPWFLQNQHIVALAGQPLSDKEMRDHSDALFLHAWRFTGGSERDSPEHVRATLARKPTDEQKCHTMYTLLLSFWSPSPDFDLWIDFGFASCTSEGEERVLCGHYQQLIKLCTFKEFSDAFRNRRLLSLFLSKGVQVDSNPQLRDLLASDLPFGWNKSVWNLKSFVVRDTSADEESGMIPPIMADYGFINCKNASERRQLKKVYKAFFINHHGDPLALHEACIKGDTYGFLSTIIQGLHGPKYPRLMKNQYPLPGVNIAGLTWAGDTHIHVGGRPQPSDSSFGDGKYGDYHVSFHPPGSAAPNGSSSDSNQAEMPQTNQTSNASNPHLQRDVSDKSLSGDNQGGKAQALGASHTPKPRTGTDVSSKSLSGDNQGGRAQTTNHEPNAHAIPNTDVLSNSSSSRAQATSHVPNPREDPAVSSRSSSGDAQGEVAQTHGTSHVPNLHADLAASSKSSPGDDQVKRTQTYEASHAPNPYATPVSSSKSSVNDNQGERAQPQGSSHTPNSSSGPNVSSESFPGDIYNGRVQAYAQAPAWQVSPIVYFVLGAVFSSVIWMQNRSL